MISNSRLNLQLLSRVWRAQKIYPVQPGIDHVRLLLVHIYPLGGTSRPKLIRQNGRFPIHERTTKITNDHLDDNESCKKNKNNNNSNNKQSETAFYP